LRKRLAKKRNAAQQKSEPDPFDRMVVADMPALLDIKAAALWLRCEVDTLRRIPRSELPVARLGKQNLYRPDSVLTLVEKREDRGIALPASHFDSQDRNRLVDSIADRARGRSRKGRTS